MCGSLGHVGMVQDVKISGLPGVGCFCYEGIIQCWSTFCLISMDYRHNYAILVGRAIWGTVYDMSHVFIAKQPNISFKWGCCQCFLLSHCVPKIFLVEFQCVESSRVRWIWTTNVRVPWSKVACCWMVILPFFIGYIWVNYDDLTATSLESWLVRGIIPKWP